MNERAATGLLPLTAARACAWALLVAGWIGIGSIALRLAPSVIVVFALVALWLLALGGAAAVATRGGLPRAARAIALAAGALITAGALVATQRGGGLVALGAALLGWAALTALASGVVRGLRQQHPVPPSPPIAAATCGALVAGVVLGDIGDAGALAGRLAVFVLAIVVVLIVLQRRLDSSPRAPGCRAGLFDCSLPAWPAGAWRDSTQWPTLLAGLAMLPMMAALPLMVDWCRAASFPPHAMVLVHLAAMFGPALVWRETSTRWSLRTLSAVCAALLVAGAAAVVFLPAPFDLIGLAAAHGAAWSLAWAGQLWAPARRGQQGTSPLLAAAGYALLTFAFGVIVTTSGARGVADVHVALGVAAVIAWVAGELARFRLARRRIAARR